MPERPIGPQFISDPSEREPVYSKVRHEGGSVTPLWFIVCDEGWRTSIVCERMYEWAADWLLDVLDRRPFATERTVPDA